MVNLIWFILMVGSVVIAFFRGESASVTMALLTESEAAVMLVITLIGSMSFWLGILSVAKAAGLVEMLARKMKSIFVILFPSIPASHPAAGSILLNLAANMLGLGNAATPLGLKAMHELEDLNQSPGKATAAMCTFLALNTCCITFIPTSIIAARMAAGSTKPTATAIVTFLSTVIATTTAVISDRICQKLWGRG